MTDSIHLTLGLDGSNNAMVLKIQHIKLFLDLNWTWIVIGTMW